MLNTDTLKKGAGLMISSPVLVRYICPNVLRLCVEFFREASGDLWFQLLTNVSFPPSLEAHSSHLFHGEGAYPAGSLQY